MITIIGLGVIGGSYALALKEAGLTDIYGVDTDPVSIMQAQAAEAIAHYKAQFMLEHPNKAKARDVEHAAEKTEGPEVVAVPGQDQDAEKGQE